MSEPEPISILIPLANAPVHPDDALTAWVDFLPTLGRETELVIIDDGTHSIESWLNERPNITFLKSESVRGLGASLRAGLEASKHPIVFYATLDYPYSPADLIEMLKRLEDVDAESGLRLDIVNGCRAGRPAPVPAKVFGFVWRNVWNFVLALSLQPSPGWLGWKWKWRAFWYRLVFGLRTRDAASGFKLFRRKIFARIPIQSDGNYAAIEILAKANFLGCYMDEVPIAKEVGASSPPIPDLGDVRKDASKVFHKPDFGPTFLSPEVTPHVENH